MNLNNEQPCHGFGYQGYKSEGGNRSLNHRKFVAFLDEVSGDLQMHTDQMDEESAWSAWRGFLHCALKSWRKAFDVMQVFTAMNSEIQIFSVTWHSLQTLLHILITSMCSCREETK